ncbi:hypothetical protein [Marinimicrobium koreense]|uniref:hypothetical protein n=1 Tax=Marinimicrobium koreense TaxID=306545 RepID=UPI003F703EE1
MGDVRKGSSILHDQAVDVVIHIGAPKTGSSAIQRFCMKNRKALLEMGFYYPKHVVDANGVSGGHSILANLLVRKSPRLARFYFRYHLLKARLLKKTLLLSSEGFCRNAKRFEPLLEGLEVRVVGWFRHPIEAFISNYNQSVKRHFCTQTLGQVFDTMATKSNPPNLSGKRLSRWANLVGDTRCTFFPYLKPSCGREERSIEERWLEAIGVRPEDFARFHFDAKRVNRSYVPDALELKRLLNVVLVENKRIDSHAIDRALQNYSDRADGEEVELGIHLAPEQVARLSRAFERANQRLVKRFPVMKPLLDKDEIYRRQAKATTQQSLDLSVVLAHLERLCPSEMEQVRVSVRQRLRNGENEPPELEDLADWLNVDGDA